jgi:tetratricopeptide (TPR) repeat protein
VAKSEKMTQKELKQPDTFQRLGHEAQDWLIERQSLILTVVGLVMVGGVIYAVADYFSTRSEEKASQQLGSALEILERPVVSTPEGTTLTPQPGEEAPFKSAKEQDEALVKALADFRSAHGGTKAAATASLPLGKAQLRLTNYDQAVAAFDAFLKDASQNEPLRAAALEGKGYAFEAQQKYDEALKAFEEMAKVNAGDYLQGMGDYHRARILIQQGKKDDAATLLVKIPVDYANTAAARLSTERTALLAAEGVKIPTPPAPTGTKTDGGA